MRIKELRASYQQVNQVLQAATKFVDGAILIDEFDDEIFDDVRRTTPLWDRINKKPAPGETTGGFEQTEIGNARSADPRNLSFSAASPSRSARERKDIRAILMNREFGIFDRSVARQQGRPFSELTMKDVQDLKVGCRRKWANLAYEGDNDGDPTEFSGLRTLLGAGTTIEDTDSIVNGLDDKIVTMTNSQDREVMPTAIYTNAKVIQMIAREFEKVGDKLPIDSLTIGGNTRQVPMFPSSIGFLPLFADPFNRVVTGTPNVYPTFIVSEDKLTWEFIEPLGMGGFEPALFEIALQNDLDLQYTCVMFGAIETIGGTNHHARMNVEERSTVVDMTT